MSKCKWPCPITQPHEHVEVETPRKYRPGEKLVPASELTQLTQELEAVRREHGQLKADLSVSQDEMHRYREKWLKADKNFRAKSELLEHVVSELAKAETECDELRESFRKLNLDSLAMHSKLVKERDNAKALIKEICDEWNEGCDPGCDSWAHEETCRAVNIAEAKRQLTKDRDRLQAQLATAVAALEGGSEKGGVFWREKALADIQAQGEKGKDNG